MSYYFFRCTVGGKNFPILSFNIRSGAYGSVGHASITTGRKELLAQRWDLFDLTATAPGGVEVLIEVQTPTASAKIFGGEFLTSDWDYDRDRVRIEARDYAGILVDQRRMPAGAAQIAQQILAPLAPGKNPSAAPISTQNQKLSEVVGGIAQEFGFTPVLNLDQDPEIGTIFGSDDTIWLAIPQTFWGLLNQLARDTGYDVYVTPDRKLVFGLPGVGTTPVKLSYGVLPVPTGTLPCREPIFRHNVRRNSTFRIQVMSYDPAKGQLTLGRADAIGTNLAGVGGLKAGIWSGQAAVQVDNQLSGLNAPSQSYSRLYTYSAGRNYVPLYTFHVDGLTQAQADARAAAIAADIAKREVTVTAVVDGFTGATPTQSLNLTGAIDSQFTKRNYYVYGYEHMFRLPAGDIRGGQGEGFLTTLLGVDVPVFGAGSPLTNPTSP